jgi:hypothetical protein
LIGLLLLCSVIIFLVAPNDIADYTIADTEYWHETGNRLMLKTAYDYNNKEEIQAFPKDLGDWKGYDFRYSDFVYQTLNADILISRTYVKGYGKIVWMDIINSKVGESFHKQNICVEGSGWTVDNDSILEFKIGNPGNPFTRLDANMLKISKENKKQIMVYWFMFKKFGSNDAVTMIRLSSPVMINESATFDSLKDFVQNQLFNAMYQSVESENITVAEYIIGKYSTAGILAISLCIIIPLSLIALGIKRKD